MSRETICEVCATLKQFRLTCSMARYSSGLPLASSPGSSQFFNVTQEKHNIMGAWEMKSCDMSPIDAAY